MFCGPFAQARGFAPHPGEPPVMLGGTAFAFAGAGLSGAASALGKIGFDGRIVAGWHIYDLRGMFGKVFGCAFLDEFLHEFDDVFAFGVADIVHAPWFVIKRKGHDEKTPMSRR